jgi:hypothetical protein
VQHACCRIERDGLARADRWRLPAAERLVIIDHHHVIGEHGAKARIGDQRIAGGIRRGRGVRQVRKVHGTRVIAPAPQGKIAV